MWFHKPLWGFKLIRFQFSKNAVKMHIQQIKNGETKIFVSVVAGIFVIGFFEISTRNDEFLS